MKLVFFWLYPFPSKKRLYPDCKPGDGVDIFSVRMLCTLFGDWGGLSRDEAISFYKDAVKKIDSVICGEVIKEEFATEVVCVDLYRGEANIYFYDEEEKIERHDINAFRRILVAWLEFIESEPSESVTSEVEI